MAVTHCTVQMAEWGDTSALLYLCVYSAGYSLLKHLSCSVPHCADGTLLQHVQKQRALPEHQARWLFQQLILAVDYCHSSGVSNRDIKLDNILLDKSMRGRPDWPILKVCDWGYARSGATSEASSKVGTLSYMAPEVLQNNSYSTKRADIWSCGVVLYAMLVSLLRIQLLEASCQGHAPS